MSYVFKKGPTLFPLTSSWVTNTTKRAYYSVDNGYVTMSIRMDFTGAPNAVGLTIDLPPGLPLDTGLGMDQIIVDGYLSAGNVFSSFAAYANSATQIQMLYNSSASGQVSAITHTAPATIASGHVLVIQIRYKYTSL